MKPLISAIFLLAAAAAASPPALAAVPEDGQLEFRVLRNGSDIGFHRLEFRERGEKLEVDIDIELQIGLGFITLFRYDHDNLEVWRDGELVAFESRTDNDGEDLAVRASVEGERMVIEGNAIDGSRKVAPLAVPTTYWNPDQLQRATTLVDTQTGELLDVTVTPLGAERITVRGQEIDATRYRVEGDLKVDLWYDAADHWVKMQFRLQGADFEYVLR